MADKLNFAARFAANLALSGRKDFHIIKASELLWDLNDGLLTIGNMLGMTKDSTIGVLRKVSLSIYFYFLLEANHAYTLYLL